MKTQQPKKATPIILLLFLVTFTVTSYFSGNTPKPGIEPYEVSYTSFIETLQQGKVRHVAFSGNRIEVESKDGERYFVNAVDDPNLVNDLLKYKVDFKADAIERPSLLIQILISWFPMILLIVVWVYFMRKAQGGGGMFGFGKSKAKLMVEGSVKVTFADVAGQEEAKEDVQEMVDFLKDPGKFSALGGRIPRGALMVGPPGTGKTLLAKAIAGEAKVPFFFISGSDFVEMFVGVGASRVRDLFAQAKAKAPCIIFIDEIDAVGRKRGNGASFAGSNESEQTLNQLLVEMDGFEGTEGIIVIAATNRADVLDPALLRPGRFDRQIHIGLPDIKGRAQILKVHMQSIALADDVEVEYLARGTPGFSGAELANLVNEAALLAARKGLNKVSMTEFEKAKDKILMGAERRTMAMSEDEKRMTAYHEAGHAIVGWLSPEHDPVYKVSIMPRGRALGITMFLPERDQYSANLDKLEGRIAALYGGRVAEELIFGARKVTTGAQNDIQRATEIARNMVTKWGLSKLGAQAFAEESGEGFMGFRGDHKAISEKTAQRIDHAVNVILETNYNRARELLEANRDKLDAMAEALMRYETIDLGQIEDIMKGLEPRVPADWKEPCETAVPPIAQAA